METLREENRSFKSQNVVWHTDIEDYLCRITVYINLKGIRSCPWKAIGQPEVITEETPWSDRPKSNFCRIPDRLKQENAGWVHSERASGVFTHPATWVILVLFSQIVRYPSLHMDFSALGLQRDNVFGRKKLQSVSSHMLLDVSEKMSFFLCNLGENWP